MCGRYYIDSDRRDDMIREVLESVETKYENTPALRKMKTGEIFPTDTAPVITQREPVLMEWGFTRFDGKGRVINARLETAGEKPMFRGCYAGQRCLIPASYYFEWEKRLRATKIRDQPRHAGLYGRPIQNETRHPPLLSSSHAPPRKAAYSRPYAGYPCRRVPAGGNAPLSLVLRIRPGR